MAQENLPIFNAVSSAKLTNTATQVSPPVPPTFAYPVPESLSILRIRFLVFRRIFSGFNSYIRLNQIAKHFHF
jgi:hypothetical protein